MMFEWPWCGRCGKPVESVTKHEDILTGKLVVVVKCHGDERRESLGPLPHDAQLIGIT